MDSFDERILTELKNSESLNFKQLLRAVEFSHNTLRVHIAQLMRQGMIVQTKKTTNGPGRPVLAYSLPPEINLKPMSYPSTYRRESGKRFSKANLNIVERLTNSLMRGGEQVAR